jgi:hypothetical protein
MKIEDSRNIFEKILKYKGRTVAYYLRHYGTNQQVAVSTPDVVIGIFQ